MQRESPPEFRRRVLAATISYQLQLKSIDYTLKRYVAPDTYEEDDTSMGDKVSDYLKSSVYILEEELKKLHNTGDIEFGIFGAEVTLYKIQNALDTARILANRGLLLEVLPILRLALEMIAWAHVAIRIKDEQKVVSLKAQSCISNLKREYQTAGQIYGYLSKFAHWGQVVHGHFLSFEEDRIGVLKASVRYRAIALALCLVILDVLMCVIKRMYQSNGDTLILRIQGQINEGETRKTYQYLSDIASLTRSEDLQEVKMLLK